MQQTIEVGRFSDGRLMVLVRFRSRSNFRFCDQDQATWVPTFAELDNLNEVLNIVNEYNENRRKIAEKLTLQAD